MKFETVGAARMWATEHSQIICVEIEKYDGAMTIYPGAGGLVMWQPYPPRNPEMVRQIRDKLTPDVSFSTTKK